MGRTTSEAEIASGMHVDAEMDAYIARRDKKRRQEEGERPEEALWRESERRENARRREQNRIAWSEYHIGRAASLRADLEALINHHEEQAEAYLGTTTERSSK